jgi:hypothetical protein
VAVCRVSTTATVVGAGRARVRGRRRRGRMIGFMVFLFFVLWFVGFV